MTSDNPQENCNPPSGQRQSNEHADSTEKKIASRVTELESPIARNKCHEPCKAKKHWLDYATFAVEILGLVGLAVYAFLTYGIWCANKKSADAAKTAAEAAVLQVGIAGRSLDATVTQFKLDQRAWVAVTSVEGTPEIGQFWTIKASARNTGKTFAEEFRGTLNAEPLKTGKLPNFAEKERVSSQKRVATLGVIPPDGILVQGTDPKTPLSKPEMEMFTSGQFSEFVYGMLTYKDVFGCSHWTKYCYQFTKTENSNNPQWILCSQYNEADTGTCH